MKLRKGTRCTYCDRKLDPPGSAGKLTATRDHVVPKSKWVPMDRIFGARLVWACRQCNSIKGDMMPQDWSAFMKANPNWWTYPNLQHGSNVREREATRRAVGQAH